MTGFGTAEGLIGPYRLTVEIRSVNHRFFNPSIKLPQLLSRWEGEVRDTVRQRVARGHVSISAWIDRDEPQDTAVIDEAVLGRYQAQLKQIGARLAIPGEPDMATLLRLPGVVTTARPQADDIESPDELMRVVVEAADGLVAMRLAEGERIAAYIEERLSVVAEALARIAVRAPVRLNEQRVRFQTSVTEMLNGSGIDPQRLAQEVAIMSDRLDIGEELSRFEAHIAAFREALATPATEAVGKRLGFLLQEMLRETNTTGSKANDAVILADVVLVKEELERLREQVENIE